MAEGIFIHATLQLRHHFTRSCVISRRQLYLYQQPIYSSNNHQHIKIEAMLSSIDRKVR
jgi:hypothetical protein